MPTSDDVLPFETVMEIQDKYEERDVRGRRVWSYRALGRVYLTSESTIMRVITRTGAYGKLPEVMKKEEANPDVIKASIAKLAQIQEAERIKDAIPKIGACQGCGKTKYLCTCGKGNFKEIKSVQPSEEGTGGGLAEQHATGGEDEGVGSDGGTVSGQGESGTGADEQSGAIVNAFEEMEGEDAEKL